MASTLSSRVASAIFSRLQPGRISQVQSLCSRCHTTEIKENQSSTPEANTSKSEKEATEKENEGKLLAEKEKLEDQIKDVTDKYKRALAETENVRQRFRKQLEESKLYAVQGFCKDLLEVADILGTATSSVPQEELDKNEHLKGLFNGLLMTESQLQKVFQKNNLFKIDPLNEKFDPNFHEAMFEVPAPDKEAGTVAVVTKIGYRLHNRTLRPALVGVTKGPS